MLQENPQKRPTIYGVLKESCNMQGKEVPIHDVSLNFRKRVRNLLTLTFFFLSSLYRSMPNERSRKPVVTRNCQSRHNLRRRVLVLFSHPRCKKLR